MKLLLVGILAGLALAIPLRLALIRYSEHSLPQPPHTGPKLITWHDGVRTERIA